MVHRMILRSSGVALLCCAITLALGLTSPVQAQEATDQDTSEELLEEVTVTGTRLRGTEPVGYHVTGLGREDIETSAGFTMDRVLKELPQVYNLGVSEDSRGQPGGNGNIVYGNSVNIHGIGPYATLVLIDGHRVTNNTRHIDPSILPTLGVGRVEVIADGASAIYGSDAIAGIVNVIPRRDLDGFEVVGRYGFSGSDGFDEWMAGAAWGRDWDSGQFMAAYEHVYRSNLSGSDRDFYTSDQRPFGGNDYRVTACNPGTITLSNGTTYAIPAGGLTAANVGSLVPGTVNRCDVLDGQDLFPQQEYDSLNATFTQEINEWLTVFADAFYSNRDFSRYGANATGTFAVPSSNAFYVPIPGYTGSYNVAYNFRDDNANFATPGHAESWQITPGVRISLPHAWQAEAMLGYGKTDDNSENTTGLDSRGPTSSLALALASSDPSTAMDVLGGNRTSQQTISGIFDQIFLAPTLNEFTMASLEFNGPLMQLPGGDASLAVGYERTHDSADLGLARGNPGTPIAWRHFTRTVDSYYAEVLVPIVGPENAMPGIERLDLNVAIRYDDYSDVGSTDNPKFGVSWSPVEAWTIRGSYGTSFRAPLISQIYGNSYAIFQQRYQDPSGGPPITGYAESGPNLDLKPETADTWSAGVDWDISDNQRFSLTYWSVDYSNQVETYLADLGILAREDAFAGTGIILRGEEAGATVDYLVNTLGVPVVGSLPPGGATAVDLFVDGRNSNLGKSITKGLDFAYSLLVDGGGNGNFIFDVSGTYIDEHKVAITSTAPLVDLRNQIYRPLKWRARGSATWQKDPLDVRVIVNYVGSYSNTLITPTQSVSTYTPIDLTVSWRFGEPGSGDPIRSGLVLTGEIRDVFDAGPPYVNVAPSSNGGGGYDPTAASPIGRLFAISLRKSW